MFGESLDLSDVLKKLKRADEALTEFVAPLWPGVTMAAVWMEGHVRLFDIPTTPSDEGYYLLGTNEDTASVLRPADAEEARRYRGFLERATVILLDQNLAFPASFAERLQGITAPRPIHFANGKPLEQVIARFDGLNLFFDSRPQADKSSPLSGFFSETSIFTPGELLGIPGTEAASGGADQAEKELEQNPALASEYRLRAILDASGSVLEDWARTDDGQIRLHWRHLDEEQTVILQHDSSPITSGICLPGSRGFDPGTLTRFLIEHALDSWRRAH